MSRPGRVGVGQTQETAFRVPESAIGYWTHRFVEKGVPHEAPVKRFGRTVLAFKDPDGMGLALVGVAGRGPGTGLDAAAMSPGRGRDPWLRRRHA